MIEQILSPELLQALGWTLVHSLWQAALFALLLGVAFLLLRKYSARIRYMTAIGVLGAFFLTAVLTFAGLYRGATSVGGEGARTTTAVASPPTSIAEPGANESGDRAIVLPETTVAISATPTVTPSFWHRMEAYYNEHLPLIVTLWLMGVLILQLRFIGQLAFLQRLKNYGTERFPVRLAPLLQELESRMGLEKPVRYLTSFRVSSPFTVGWLRPAVLFPRGLLGELDEAQLRTIIAHELAHIKRYDFLVNLIQTLLCILFFYHPAAWWISARIDEEREHCCDDLAIAITGEAVGYARTLLQLKESELARTSLAMGLLGKGDGFRARITRLLSSGLGTGTYGEGFTTAVIIFCFMGLAVTLSGQQPGDLARAQVQSKDVEAMSVPPPPPPPAPLAPPSPGGLEDHREPDAGLTDEQVQRIDAIAEEVLSDSPVNYDKWEGTPASKFDLFIGAILGGDIELVEYFLDNENFQLDQVGRNDYTPLIAAANSGNLAITRLLLDRGASVDVVNPNGFNALLEAIDEGNIAMVRLLIDAGADVNFVNAEGWTPLMETANEDHPEIAALLIEAEADYDYVNRQGWTALIEAADEDSYATAVVLLEAGADPNLKGRGNGRSALAMAGSEGHPRFFALLIEYGADVFSAGGGMHPLHTAAEEGEIEAVRQLLSLGADVNVTDGNGRTPLSYAAEEGKREIVRLLLRKEARTDITDQLGRTPLYYAIEEEQARIVDDLLAADPGAADGALDQALNVMLEWLDDELEAMGPGRTFNDQTGYPRGYAVEVVWKLLDLGASSTRIRPDLGYIESADGVVGFPYVLDRDAKVYDGSSNSRPWQRYGEARTDGQRSANDLLVAAVANDDIDNYAKYYAAGADPNGSSTNGYTALTMASREGHNIDTKRLVGDGADPDQPDARGMTPLTEAAQNGKFNVIRTLLELGADPDRKDKNGKTARQYALEQDDKKSLRLLPD